MLKKLRILISAQHALMLAYRAEIYLWVLAHILPFIMMSIWAEASARNGGVGFSMKPQEYVRYFLAVFAVRQFSAVWMIYDFEWQVVEGRLTYHLLRPLNALWHFVAAHLGEQLARVPFFVICVAAFCFFNHDAFWIPSPSAALIGVVAIYAAFALRFAMQYCLATLTFWFERASSIDQLFFVPYLFVSGMVIPLKDMPPQVERVVRLTPFPYMVDFPATILTGSLKFGDPAMWQGFGIMAAWFALFAGLGAFLWKRGLHQYSGQGA